MITQGTGSVCSGHLWKAIFWTMPELLKRNTKGKTPQIIISLANIIKSFKLYEDYQLSQQRDSFTNIFVRQGAKGRTPSLPVMVGLQPGPPLSAWQLSTVFLPRLTLTSHMWLKHPVCLCLNFQAVLGTSEGWRTCPTLNLGRFQPEKWQIFCFT